MTKRDFNKRIVPGRWIRVNWTDIGAEDGIVVGDINKKYQSFLFYGLHSENTQTVYSNQILKVGDYLSPDISGLNKD
jgi:hypothetical protein